MESKLSNKNNATNKQKDTMCLTFKTVVPHEYSFLLDELFDKSKIEVNKMLVNRGESSSKYYKTIPCVVAKSLISKYQKNKKCKELHSLVLPICGDKGKQVKIVEGGIRIPALFKKDIIPILFPRPIVGFIRQVEFFKRNKIWQMSYSYNTPIKATPIFQDVYLGVDRNSVGNVAAVSLPNGEHKLLGFDTAGFTKNFRNRRAKLQTKGAKNALKKIKQKQSRRIKCVNHKVSKTIVNLAKKHCCGIKLENLGSINKRGSKAKRYVQKSQWSFYQLETFITYKATLLGIPIYYINPRNTSKTCSRCGSINIANGKHYKCKFCGYVAHRDINASINIRRSPIEQGRGRAQTLSGLIDNPLNYTASALVETESSGGDR